MERITTRLGRWMAFGGMALVLAACGGGGEGPGQSISAPSTPDVRNGSYVMLAADAREYTLALDFDADTYGVTGTGVNQTGTFTASGDAFLFTPGNSTGATGTSTLRFSYVDNTVVGEFALPGGAVPFVAPRVFETTLAGAVGTYNFLGRVVDTTGGAPNTTIQQAEITADGRLRTCDDANVFEISACPAGSVTTGTLTLDGDVFTSTTPGGAFPFRIARVGAGKVFLRASPSTGSTRRFIVGTQASTGFTAGTFAGGTTEPAWGTVTISPSAFSSSGTSPAGVTTTRTGNAAAAGGGTLASLLVVNTATAGSFFATRSAEIGVVVAARNSVQAPGFMAIGKRQ